MKRSVGSGWGVNTTTVVSHTNANTHDLLLSEVAARFLSGHISADLCADLEKHVADCTFYYVWT